MHNIKLADPLTFLYFQAKFVAHDINTHLTQKFLDWRDFIEINNF